MIGGLVRQGGLREWDERVERDSTVKPSAECTGD